MDLSFGEPARGDTDTGWWREERGTCVSTQQVTQAWICDLTDHSQREQADTAPSPPLPTFTCNVCLWLLLKLLWLLKATGKLLSQQHLKGHIPNLLITIFPLLKSCPFYCFIGSNAALLEPTLGQSRYTPKQAFKQTNKAQEMPVSSPTQINLRNDTSTAVHRTIQRSHWLVSTTSPGLITDSRQVNALILRDEANSLTARKHSRLYPTRDPMARSRLRANTGALLCNMSEMKPCSVPPLSTKKCNPINISKLA